MAGSQSAPDTCVLVSHNFLTCGGQSVKRRRSQLIPQVSDASGSQNTCSAMPRAWEVRSGQVRVTPLTRWAQQVQERVTDGYHQYTRQRSNETFTYANIRLLLSTDVISLRVAFFDGCITYQYYSSAWVNTKCSRHHITVPEICTTKKIVVRP